VKKRFKTINKMLKSKKRKVKKKKLKLVIVTTQALKEEEA
jgi:hypothetical protein